ncbi:hypothetical protein Bbelb_219300 [Branchiostoma belcheri]|nr:hypothetical protein Bbelb_219300 [Branchiostoma belcheri]
MPQISTTDNPVEAIHHTVVNDRCETGQHVAVEANSQREKERKAPSWRDENAPVHTAQGSATAANEFGKRAQPCTPVFHHVEAEQQHVGDLNVPSHVPTS